MSTYFTCCKNLSSEESKGEISEKRGRNMKPTQFVMSWNDCHVYLAQCRW